MVRGGAIALVVVGLAACEFPTEPPRWDQTWVVPVERIRIGVAELLPDGVTVSDDTSAFVTATPGASATLSLAEMCGAPCLLAAGFTAPKPAFSDTLTTRSTLPAELIRATLAGGSLDATLAHSFSFDPLRPSEDPGAARGHMVIRVTSGGSEVAYDSIDGADQAFPASVTLTPSLAVQPVQVTDTVEIAIAVISPAGDSTTIDNLDTLGVSFAPSTLELADATVAAAGIAIDSVTTTMRFGGMDSTTLARVRSGALRFRVQNPFTVTGALDMSFRGGFPAIQHTLDIREGSYGERVDFTGDEVREILGSDSVDVVASGDVSAADGTLTVEPWYAMILDSEFELTVLVGPQDQP